MKGYIAWLVGSVVVPAMFVLGADGSGDNSGGRQFTAGEINAHVQWTQEQRQELSKLQQARTEDLKPLYEQFKQLQEELKPLMEQVKPLQQQMRQIMQQVQGINEQFEQSRAALATAEQLAAAREWRTSGPLPARRASRMASGQRRSRPTARNSTAGRIRSRLAGRAVIIGRTRGRRMKRARTATRGSSARGNTCGRSSGGSITICTSSSTRSGTKQETRDASLFPARVTQRTASSRRGNREASLFSEDHRRFEERQVRGRVAQRRESQCALALLGNVTGTLAGEPGTPQRASRAVLEVHPLGLGQFRKRRQETVRVGGGQVEDGKVGRDCVGHVRAAERQVGHFLTRPEAGHRRKNQRSVFEQHAAVTGLDVMANASGKFDGHPLAVTRFGDDRCLMQVGTRRRIENSRGRFSASIVASALAG